MVTVTSLVTQLSLASPLENQVEKALWTSKSHRKANILVWIMLYGLLNCASVMQRKLPSHCLSPSICPLCTADSEGLQHLFFTCGLAEKCWHRLFACFNLSWAFSNIFGNNVLQILIGPRFKKQPQLLWINVVKALLVEIWFEQNQRVFKNKVTCWIDRYKIA